MKLDLLVSGQVWAQPKPQLRIDFAITGHWLGLTHISGVVIDESGVEVE